MKSLTSTLAILVLIVMLSACGGGGGGNGDITALVTAAEVSIEATPRDIDLGDRIAVTIHVENLATNGALIKIRYPDTLQYTNDSGQLADGGLTAPTTPIRSPQSSGHDRYVVFYLSNGSFGSPGASGNLRFLLRGVLPHDRATIEVDTDIHNPKLSLTSQFDINNPLFAAEDSVTIRVRKTSAG